ncbi:hypothetical protein HDU99_001907 [Rhizoclosmatium hyalinum]|nr:hypothetical protein HDU99_001907 [Rhizoclosmatium hyalinum]
MAARRASSASLTSSSGPVPIDVDAALSIMRNALHVVINHVDAKGRFVAELFMTLVDRKLYPDYYKVITRPIAIDIMLERIENNHYARLGAVNGLAAFEADFATLANNAMTYNQIGSDVYKDAKTLLSLFQHDFAKETKLAEIDPQSVKYKNVVNNIMAFQDNSERYVWDVFFELPDKKLYKDYYFSIKQPIALDGILTKIDSHQYKTSDSFVADIHLMIRNAKTYNVEGSQIYRDAQSLEVFFKEQFTKYVINGTAASMAASAATAGTSTVGPRTTVAPVSSIVEGEPLESVTVGTEVYRAGDYVYITNAIDPSKPTIGQIQSTYKSIVTGNPSFTAAWFLRPQQTYQLASAKFIENEVLKTNRTESYDAQEIVGRCWVLYVKDYLRGKPKGCNDIETVHPCESRYTIDGKSTSKIKLWQNKFPEPELVLYDTPLHPVRVPMFKDETVAAAPATVGLGVDSKKRKSEDYGDAKDDYDYHQDKKLKREREGQSSRNISTPSVSTPTAGREHRDRTKSSTGTIPSLSQQVASLVLPGTKAAAAAAGNIERGTNNSSNANSGTATPNHNLSSSSAVGGAGSSSAAPASNSTDAAGALGPIFELFDRTPAGEVKWYAGLPVHVVKRETVVHSLQYRIAKMKERKAAAEAGGMKEEKMDVDETLKVEAGGEANGYGQHQASAVDLEAQLWTPMKDALYNLAHAYLH